MRPRSCSAPRPGIEAAHTAPLRDLANLLQVARDEGIRIATSWQDASQIHQRYGKHQANSIISASQTRVILPGSSDPATLELARSLIGERHPVHWSEQRRPPLDPRRLDGKMLVSHAHEPAFLLRPAPWYRSRAMRRLAQPAPGTGNPARERDPERSLLEGSP